MKNVRRRLYVSAISTAIALPALLSAAPADAAPAKGAPGQYPLAPSCPPQKAPEPAGSSISPCAPQQLIYILEATAVGSSATGSSAGSSTGS